MTVISDTLKTAAPQMNIKLTDNMIAAFERYYDMLEEGNRAFNLTGSLTREDAVTRHFLDSITPESANLLIGSTLADVGSGAGFPGVPIAIIRPDIHVTMIDSLSKRIDFLRSVIEALSLNATAIHIRAETAGFSMRASFDTVVSRAVAPLPVLLELMLPLCRVGGRCLALKGPGIESELIESENALSLLGNTEASIYPVSIPGTDWNHTILSLDKLEHTPHKFPRKPGRPSKSPL